MAAMIDCGIPSGANMPNHTRKSRAGYISLSRGTSGKSGRRSRPRTARSLALPATTWRKVTGSLWIMHDAGQEVGHSFAGTAIGYVENIDACMCLEGFTD